MFFVLYVSECVYMFRVLRVMVVDVIKEVDDVNELNRYGVLFFYEVVVKGDIEGVKLLFEYGVEVNR